MLMYDQPGALINKRPHVRWWLVSGAYTLGWGGGGQKGKITFFKKVIKT